jgi:hypothetical protein
MRDARAYLDKAAECDRLAQQCSDRHMAATYRELANQWRYLAKQADFLNHRAGPSRLHER